jgi:glycosyltransferase involved in cell wall biosynthesis
MEEGVHMKRPLRIAMVAYANYFTDARIKNYVDALQDEGACVDVFALGRRRERVEEGTLRVYLLARKYWGTSAAGYAIRQLVFMLAATWRLLVQSVRARYDVVHTHNMPDVIALTALPLKLFGTKVILDIHDTMPEAYATKFGLGLNSVPVKLLIAEERLSAAVADRVIATNALHKEVLVRHGIRSTKIEEILNVGNHKVFRPMPHASNGAEFWLGYHGTIARRLGLFLILDALRLVREECPGLRFLCIGEGEDLPALKQYAEDCSISSMIVWKEFVAVEQLPGLLQRVHAGVIGNGRETEQKHNYMLPVKMLEYAAMEIPTIAPRLKVIERYFDEDSAFFYGPDDAAELAATIRSIYVNRGVLFSRIEGLRRFNATHNWNVMAKRYMSLLEELVQR